MDLVKHGSLIFDGV